jgi:hypothetical protein
MSKRSKCDWKMPKTWKGKMEAIVAGAVDYDDIESLAMECASIADKAMDATKAKRQGEAKAKGCMDVSPTWSWAMSEAMLPRLFSWNGGDLTDEQAATNAEIVKCGAVADAFLAGEIQAA